jgi:hypothetical protein
MQHHYLFAKAKANTTAGFAGTEKRDEYFVEQFR